MAVRTTRLIGPNTLAAGGSITYTAPAGKVGLIKYITYNFAGADLVTLQHNGNGGVYRTIMQRTGAGPNTSIEVTCFVVVLSGESVQWKNNGANNVQVAAFGAELVL